MYIMSSTVEVNLFNDIGIFIVNRREVKEYRICLGMWYTFEVAEITTLRSQYT